MIQSNQNRARRLASLLLIALFAFLAACDNGTPQQPATEPEQSAQPTTAPGQSVPDIPPTATSSTGSQNNSADNYKVIDLTGVDPCTLISREEAEALMGPLDWAPSSNSGVQGSALGTKTCTYDPKFKQDSQKKALIVDLWPAPDSWTIGDRLEGGNVKGLAASDVGLGSETFPRYKYDYLPQVCANKTPCVLTNDTMDWQYVYAILPDRTAVSVKVFPKSLENATTFTRKILEQPPFK